MVFINIMKYVFLIMAITTFSFTKVTEKINNHHSFLSENEKQFKVRLIVFSGTEDPSFTITSKEMSKLKNTLSSFKFKAKSNTRVMGYKGFLIKTLYSNEQVHFIKGNPNAEYYLLNLAKINGIINSEVYSHVEEQISISYEVSSEDSKLEVTQKIFKESCENTPIIGPDTIPNFDPNNDDQGCFEVEQWNNNCYNYGNDIVTNTFAQPGKGTEQKWKENTCEDVKRAAISDGLQWIGTEYPSEAPASGHYIALLIWPDTNFHWIRLDSNNLWSHKPGGTEITNKDNNGNFISNPSIQDFSPWSHFCGYFLTVPSKITIS